MEEDEGSEDGIPELIADLCKGEVLGENMCAFVKKHLHRKVSSTSTYAQFTFVCEVTSYKVFPSDHQRRIQCDNEVIRKCFPRGVSSNIFR
jgi:hypothetical protein